MGDAIEFINSRAKKEPEPAPGIFKCEHPIEVRERDCEGKTIVLYHKKCGKPAAVRRIVGTLTWATAVLCDEHAAHEDYRTAISTNGYPLGRIDKDAAAAGHRQERLPGIGVQK